MGNTRTPAIRIKIIPPPPRQPEPTRLPLSSHVLVVWVRCVDLGVVAEKEKGGDLAVLSNAHCLVLGQRDHVGGGRLLLHRCDACEGKQCVEVGPGLGKQSRNTINRSNPRSNSRHRRSTNGLHATRRWHHIGGGLPGSQFSMRKYDSGSAQVSMNSSLALRPLSLRRRTASTRSDLAPVSAASPSAAGLSAIPL